MSEALKEAPRDQVESEFTAILRRLRENVPRVLAGVFVDVEGECIDYASALPPYDAKVYAAHMIMMMDALRVRSGKVGFGEPTVLEVSADDRDVWVNRVGDGYVLVVVLEAGFDRVDLSNALTQACGEFRAAVGLAAPSWEETGKRLSVYLRSAAAGWNYAPEGYSDGRVRVVISDVLGRWTEPGGVRGEQLVCFRVRTDDGHELTLVHDPDIDGWITRD